jgi:hypothetical protein
VACRALTFAVVQPVTPLPMRPASRTATLAPSRLSSRAAVTGHAASQHRHVDPKVARELGTLRSGSLVQPERFRGRDRLNWRRGHDSQGYVAGLDARSTGARSASRSQ